MTDASNAEALIGKSITRLTAETEALEREIQSESEQALEDWLLVEACKDYDTIELDGEITGKAHRKKFKALRDKKRNTEKMIVALQELLQTAQAPEGEKLRKKFESEREKYQI
jgi:hypothetical protein